LATKFLPGGTGFLKVLLKKHIINLKPSTNEKVTVLSAFFIGPFHAACIQSASR
jgi:hypothetical protein